MAETFAFQKKVPLVDADGRPICEGSVLCDVNDGDRGVVTWVGRVGAVGGPSFAGYGDLAIRILPSVTRVTNRYDQWRHVPEDEQTYEERYLSWLARPYDHSLHEEVSEKEGYAIDGIMALLPSDAVDWDYGPFPDSIENALGILVRYLKRVANHD